jgi:acetyltransferase-like isoleucine patch superfamily enzyme
MKTNFFLEFISLIFDLPTKIKGRIKRKTILNSFQHVGENFQFNPLNSIIPKEGSKSVGDNVFVGDNAYFGGDISIGNNVMFGPNVTLVGGNHIFAIKGKHPRYLKPIPRLNPEPILIEDENWIGANVVILGNVTIGIGSVIGAGSVVVNNISPFTISVGNPCRPKKQIFSNSDLSTHLLEIGYSADFAIKVVQRRKNELKNIALPIVDKTEQITDYIYDLF